MGGVEVAAAPAAGWEEFGCTHGSRCLERVRDGRLGRRGELALVARLLPDALRCARPELCFYLAGADPFAGDRLGRLALTTRGLRVRDALVRDTLRAAGVPVCLTLAGGYAEDVRDTVEINLGTVETFSEWR